MAPRGFGLAGCPALPAVKGDRGIPRPQRIVIRQPRTRALFSPLPWTTPTACRSRGSAGGPGRTPCLADGPAFARTERGVSPSLHARYASPSRRLNRCTTALLAEAMRGLSLRPRGWGISFREDFSSLRLERWNRWGDSLGASRKSVGQILVSLLQQVILRQAKRRAFLCGCGRACRAP
jgi:hypothetical protein